MTENIIKFPEKPEPYLSGTCFCLKCGHEWVGCCPVGTIDLQCPNCSSIKGMMKYEVVMEADHYQCNCGNMYFSITPDFIYCPNCGLKHQPYD